LDVLRDFPNAISVLSPNILNTNVFILVSLVPQLVKNLPPLQASRRLLTFSQNLAIGLYPKKKNFYSKVLEWIYPLRVLQLKFTYISHLAMRAICPSGHLTPLDTIIPTEFGERNNILLLFTLLHMPQAGRSRVPLPVILLDFPIDLILPASLWPWGGLSL
jgi:hypothetical protein